MNLTEKIEEWEEIFIFIDNHIHDWEKVIMEGKLKIKTNQHKVQFEQMEQILEKFNLRISDVSYTDYYGIIFGIEKKSS